MANWISSGIIQQKLSLNEWIYWLLKFGNGSKSARKSSWVGRTTRIHFPCKSKIIKRNYNRNIYGWPNKLFSCRNIKLWFGYGLVFSSNQIGHVQELLLRPTSSFNICRAISDWRQHQIPHSFWYLELSDRQSFINRLLNLCVCIGSTHRRTTMNFHFIILIKCEYFLLNAARSGGTWNATFPCNRISSAIS